MREGETYDCPAAICIPIRDEERRLPALMARLATIQKLTPNLLIALTFDGCRDAGWEVVQPFLAPSKIHAQQIVRSEVPNAGRARVAAMSFGRDLLHQHFAGKSPGEFYLLSTDADTIPNQDWVRSARSNLATVDVVAGLTRLDNTRSCPHRQRLEAYLERLHTIRRQTDSIDYDPAPSHPYVGGANLGVRLSTYTAIGGVRPIACGEDSDFVRRARRSGYRVRHARDMQVVTSSRLVGRASEGLASALVEAETRPLEVEHPLDAIHHYCGQAVLRRMYDQPSREYDLSAEISARWSLSPAAILQELEEAPSADAFVTRVSEGKARSRIVRLETAEAILDSCDSSFVEAA